ncbi:hypothetical protein [uncultured Methylobacterium sp.]|uniref:hypothetical protein n=1 Tax=uncultured Methylobacterium sp. TaxID=157278 RepID=UPI0035CB2ECB
MKMSEEFKTFGLQFIQDIELRGETLDELLQSVLGPFKGDARVRLRAFLDEAVNARVSDAELQTLWNATPSDIYFRDASELRVMLTAARDRL